MTGTVALTSPQNNQSIPEGDGVTPSFVLSCVIDPVPGDSVASVEFTDAGNSTIGAASNDAGYTGPGVRWTYNWPVPAGAAQYTVKARATFATSGAVIDSGVALVNAIVPLSTSILRATGDRSSGSWMHTEHPSLAQPVYDSRGGVPWPEVSAPYPTDYPPPPRDPAVTPAQVQVIGSGDGNPLSITVQITDVGDAVDAYTVDQLPFPPGSTPPARNPYGTDDPTVLDPVAVTVQTLVGESAESIAKRLGDEMMKLACVSSGGAEAGNPTTPSTGLPTDTVSVYPEAPFAQITLA